MSVKFDSSAERVRAVSSSRKASTASSAAVSRCVTVDRIGTADERFDLGAPRRLLGGCPLFVGHRRGILRRGALLVGFGGRLVGLPCRFVGFGACVLGVVSLYDGDEPDGDGDCGEYGGDSGEEAQPSGPPSRLGVFTITELSAGVDEFGFLPREGFAGGELRGRCRGGALGTGRRRYDRPSPSVRWPTGAPGGREGGAFFHDPSVEPRPGAEQRFVGHGDLIVIDDEQARSVSVLTTFSVRCVSRSVISRRDAQRRVSSPSGRSSTIWSRTRRATAWPSWSSAAKACSAVVAMAERTPPEAR